MQYELDSALSEAETMALVNNATRALTALLARSPSLVADSGATLADPTASSKLFQLRLAAEKREHFEVAFLDTQHRMLCVERLFSGGIDSAEVHVRVVAQRALELNAAALVVAHNHPSGNPEPSAADRALTNRLREALYLFEIRLLDHIIVSSAGVDGATSMAKRGWL